jgi:threonine synthase
VTDEEILEAQRLLADREGIFVEPASAASVAGLLKRSKAGECGDGGIAVCVTTGHGLKDPGTAIEQSHGEVRKVPADRAAVWDVIREGRG